MRTLRFIPYMDAIKHPIEITRRRKMTMLGVDVSRGYSPQVLSVVFDGNVDIGKPFVGSDEDLIQISAEHIGKKSYTVFFAEDVDPKLREMLGDMVLLPMLESNQQMILSYEAPTRYAYTGYRGARSIEVNYEIRDQKVRAYDIFEHLNGRVEVIAITTSGKAYHMSNVLDIEHATWEDLPGRYHDRKTLRIDGRVVILEAVMGDGTSGDRFLVNDKVVNLAGFTVTDIVIHTEDHGDVLLLNSTDGRLLPIRITGDGDYKTGMVSTMPVVDRSSKVLYGPGTRIGNMPMAIQIIGTGEMATHAQYVEVRV